MKKLVAALGLMVVSFASHGASDCYTSYVSKPTPMLGNSGEIVTLSDGTNWKVGIGEYNYLYQYYPNVTICPSKGTITLPDTLNPKAISVSKVSSTTTTSGVTTTPTVKTVAPTVTVPRCDNTSAQGTYNLQWSGTKDGKSVSGTYQLYFDGTTDKDGFGVMSLGGFDSVNSFSNGKTGAWDVNFIALDNQFYKVYDSGCYLGIVAALPDKSTFNATIFLDLMDATTKPYRATHGTGFASVYNIPVTITMTRWIK